MCEAIVKLHGEYKNVCFTVLKDLLTDVVLGQDFMHRHESVNIHFGGTEAPLNLNALKALKTPHPPQLFQYLTKDCHLIVTKSRRHSTSDNHFVAMKTKHLLLEGIIKHSNLPWRAQVLITTKTIKSTCASITAKL